MCGFAVVCDGMGGARAGGVASKQASEIFHQNLFARLPDTKAEELPELLIGVAEDANRAIFRRSATEAECRGMGTTVVAVAATEGDNVCVVNVGDSRCYLVDSQSITQVTRDHSLVNDLVARGDITPEQARNHPNKNLITRVLGVEERVKPDVFHVQRRKGSFLLLCSDGLSNAVTDPELLYEVIHGGEPEDCCLRLLEVALSKGASDNVTAVLVQL